MKEQLSDRIKDLQNVFETAKSFSIQKNLDRLIEKVVKRVPVFLNADRCTLFIIDDKRNLSFNFIYYSRSEISEIRFSLNLGITGLTIRTKKIQNIDDVYSHPDFYIIFDYFYIFTKKNEE